MKNKRGFTLVELLIVVVILGIITLISLPVIRNISSSNTEKQYEVYRDSLKQGAKLYVDSYNLDLFGRKSNGCVQLTYQQLYGKGLIKDITLKDISCNSDSTFVKVTKFDDQYSYTPELGCGKVNAAGNVELPENAPVMDETCSSTATTLMRIDADPSNSVAFAKSKNVTVTVTSNLGINSQSAKIYYGVSTDPNSDVPEGGWQILPMEIKDRESQKRDILNGKRIVVTSKLDKLFEGLTGKYYLILKVESLTNLDGDNWNDGSNNWVIFGPYAIDNTPPVWNTSTVISSKEGYNALKPQLALAVTDVLATEEELKLCVSYDTDTEAEQKAACPRTVKAIRQGTKYVSYKDNKNKIWTDLQEKYTSPYDHKIYITVADPAGNYITKSFAYRIAYKIAYDKNTGDDGTMNATYCNKGATCKLRKNSFTKTGYDFVKWNTKADGTGTNYTNEEDITSKITGSLKLYAQWNANKYTIEFDGNGSTGGSTAAKECTYDQNCTLTANGFKRTGYTFAGWAKTASGEKKYDDKEKVKNLATSGKVTLYAKWTANKYTITVDARGGSIPTTSGWTVSTNGYNLQSASKTVTFDSTYGALPTPTRAGYAFGGWYSIIDYGTLTIPANASNKFNYKSILDNVQPGVTYTITLNASRTAGSAAQFSARIYDFTTKKDMATKVDTAFGNNKTITITCNSSADKTHQLSLLLYAGVSGSTANNAVSFTNIKIGTMGNTTSAQYTKDSKVTTAANHVLNAKWTGCGAGKYSDGNTCKDCAKGTYSTGSANASCTACPAGYSTSSTGSTAKTACKISCAAGKRVATADAKCSNCATGYSSSAHEVAAGSTSSCTANKYTITVDARGGSIPATSGWTVSTNGYGLQSASKSVTFDSTYGALPTPTRAGYGFGGWYSIIDYGTLTIPASATSKFNYRTILDNVQPGVTYTITLNASRTAGSASQFSTRIYDFTDGKDVATRVDTAFGNNKTITITCNSNANKSHQLSLLLYAGISGSTANNAVSFTNIKIGTMGNTTLTQYTKDSKVSTAANHVLNAKWTGCGAGKYSDGSTCKDCAKGYYSTGSANASCTKCPDGYSTSGTGSTVKTACQISCSANTRVTAADGKCTGECSSGYSIAAHTVTAGSTSAACTANKYTISFNANGGSGGQTGNISATYGSAMPNINKTAPTKAGYKFGGWYSQKQQCSSSVVYSCDWRGCCSSVCGAQPTTVTNCSTIYDSQYYDASGNSVKNWDKVSDTTLYAQWIVNTFTVTFDGNGGTPSYGSKTVTYGDTYGDLPSASRSGYSFMGWYTSTSGSFDYRYYVERYTDLMDAFGYNENSLINHWLTWGLGEGRICSSTNINKKSTVTQQSNHTLYAIWRQNQSSGGGGGSNHDDDDDGGGGGGNQCFWWPCCCSCDGHSCGGCFLAGTKVVTPFGLRDIDKIRVGDLVLSYNEKTGLNEYKKVEKPLIHINYTENWFTLTFDDSSTLKVAQEHRFYIKNEKGINWIRARELRIGDSVMYADGSYHKIIGLSYKLETHVEYNLVVEDNHNYYVGDPSVLVHNFGQEEYDMK